MMQKLLHLGKFSDALIVTGVAKQQQQQQALWRHTVALRNMASTSRFTTLKPAATVAKKPKQNRKNIPIHTDLNDLSENVMNPEPLSPSEFFQQSKSWLEGIKKKGKKSYSDEDLRQIRLTY